MCAACRSAIKIKLEYWQSLSNSAALAFLVGRIVWPSETTRKIVSKGVLSQTVVAALFRNEVG